MAPREMLTYMIHLYNEIQVRSGQVRSEEFPVQLKSFEENEETDTFFLKENYFVIC